MIDSVPGSLAEGADDSPRGALAYLHGPRLLLKDLISVKMMARMKKKKTRRRRRRRTKRRTRRKKKALQYLKMGVEHCEKFAGHF